MLKHAVVEIRRGHRYLYHKVVLAAFFFRYSESSLREVANKELNILFLYGYRVFFKYKKKNAASLQCRMKNKDLKECGTSTV